MANKPVPTKTKTPPAPEREHKHLPTEQPETSLARRDATMTMALPENAPTGFEFGQPEDQLLPRIGLCQSMSPQRKKSSELYIEGLQEGDFFNNITMENYGPAIEVVPLLKYNSRIYFAAMEQGGGIICRSFNAINGGQLCEKCADCEHYGWKLGDDNERIKPDCTLFMNYPAYVLKKAGDVDLAVLSFKSTLIGLGRQWYTRMSMITMPNGKTRPMYGGAWRVKSASKQKDKYQWYSATVESLGPTPARILERAFADARGLTAMIGKTMVFDVRGVGEEVATEDNPVSTEM